jgi:hypothetical protein
MTEFNPLNETHVASARAAVVEAAKGLRFGGTPFIESVRTISGRRFTVPGALDSPDFLLFAAIDSETDHLPAPHMRSQCSASWLQACDGEAAEVAAAYAEAVNVACERILLLLSEAA